MKFIRFYTLLAGILTLLYGCTFTASDNKADQSEETSSTEVTEAEAPSAEDSGYDEALAKQLGADDYGMKKYIFALLKAGPSRDQDSTTAAGIQKAHLANISRLAEEGKLVAAGPFLEDGDFQGIFVFNVETIEEAQKLTETDPAVQAGRLIFEFHPWYSSATLQLIGEWHKKVARLNP